MESTTDRERIALEDVESVFHFGVIRDWVIKLKDGREIELGAEIVKKMLQHENQELGFTRQPEPSANTMEAIRNIFQRIAHYRQYSNAEVDEILKLFPEYVQLDPDQSLPKNPDVPDEYNELACGAEDDSDNISKSFYELGQQDMLKQGWRKVVPNLK